MATILKPAYGSSAALTVTALQTLASSTGGNLLTGWQSDVLDNTSGLSVDEIVTGIIFSGGSAPTTGTVCEIWAWGILDDTPTYPDAIVGTGQATVTITTAAVKLSGAFARLGSITVDTAINKGYPFHYSLAQNGFGFVPKKWGLFITHNFGQTLKSSSNIISHIPLQYTNV